MIFIWQDESMFVYVTHINFKRQKDFCNSILFVFFFWISIYLSSLFSLLKSNFQVFLTLLRKRFFMTSYMKCNFNNFEQGSKVKHALFLLVTPLNQFVYIKKRPNSISEKDALFQKFIFQFTTLSLLQWIYYFEKR